MPSYFLNRDFLLSHPDDIALSRLVAPRLETPIENHRSELGALHAAASRIRKMLDGLPSPGLDREEFEANLHAWLALVEDRILERIDEPWA